VTTFDHTRTTICDAIIDGVTFEKSENIFKHCGNKCRVSNYSNYVRGNIKKKENHCEKNIIIRYKF
jgi:hypothetical protein